MLKMRSFRGLAVLSGLGFTAQALAGVDVCEFPDYLDAGGGKINISGATLFVDFFKTRASTNDFIDVDGDGLFGYDEDHPSGEEVDQLAPDAVPFPPTNQPPVLNNWWLVQYRSVGSVNGLEEFLAYQSCGELEYFPPSEGGFINRSQFATNGAPSGGFVIADCTGDGSQTDESGTPECPCTVDMSSIDVPTIWGVQFGDASGASWDAKPGADGYGQPPFVSWDTGFAFPLPSLIRDCGGGCDGDANGDNTVDPLDYGFVLARLGCSVGTGNADCDAADVNGDLQVDPLDAGYTQARFGACDNIVVLNTDTDAPNENTIYDFAVSWSPIVYIANRGTGISEVDVTEMQHLFVSGRMPSGENLIAATRSAGSGTRNGIMNTSGIDPSQGRGENLGNENLSSTNANLGANTQASNQQGSSQIETAVEMRRLSIGYTGLLGSSRADGDEASGRYEILNVVNDHVGGEGAVRPNINNLLDNSDPDTGWILGGPQTLTTLGDPFETDSGSDTYVDNQTAADYLRNLDASILAFETAPTSDQNFFSPGQLLALTFILRAGVDALPTNDDPTNFVDNVDVNQTLQDYIRANNGFTINGYGTRNPAGRTPVRNSSVYDDGGTAAYLYRTACGGATLSLAGGSNLGQRNRTQGDFDNDGDRDLGDIDEMVDALADPLNFECGIFHAGDKGAQSENVAIAHVIGDFDGDGNFRAADIRYAADGTAMVDGTLDRAEGFTAVDDAFGGNFFGTTICTGAAYVNGDSRADVAGSVAYPGAQPHGHDGVINADDVQYVCDNYGDWSDLDQAALIDLSADMNGDLVIDAADVDVVMDILGVSYSGDCDDAVAAAQIACP